MIKIISMILLFSAPAMSCPNLTGTYQCEEEGLVTVTQTEVNGYTVYTITDAEGTETAVADNVERAYVDENGGQHYLTSSCSGNMLNTDYRGDVMENGQKQGTYSGRTSTTKNADTITHLNKITVAYGGQVFHEETTYSCKEL